MATAEHVTRKIYFFKIARTHEVVGVLEGAIAKIASLPFNEQGRYQVSSNEDVLLALFVDSGTFPLRLQFACIRRDNLPVVEKGGDLSPLKLDDDAGLMDCCHVVIFDDGIVAAEFNQEGPRLRRLGQYLMFKGGLPSPPRFNPLFQTDVLR